MAPRDVVDASQLYRFKDITTVPTAKDLIDIVLSRTQRKTPTVVHPQYDIRRIRSFYMRKVKYCQQTFHDKFATILTQFPKLDDIHPFYANLCNVLYDKDHFKLALGQVNSVRNVVDTIAKEYVRLLKYADSPYKCKMLKRAAMGRMCTGVKKLNKSLSYLEEVRKHLSRLPGINPFTRTLLLAGHPNVGKSTFMNAISNANVEVAEWAFTTKSPFVGHFDYDYNKWQIIDTPGVLDRPLTARNTVELTAITSMAYISCSILFLVDISGTCGHSVEQQVMLFHSLRPLLQHKPVVVVLNKTDLRAPEDLSLEEQTLIKSMAEGFDCIHFVACSTANKVNLDEAKNKACEMLLAVRQQKKLMSGKSAVQGLYVADVLTSVERPAFTPQGYDPAKSGSAEMDDRVLEKDRMEAEGGAGVYVVDDRKNWLLKNPDWKYDSMPEIYNGKNVSDFIDPDIDEKLRALEKEEDELEAVWDPQTDAPTEEWYDAQAALHEVMVERETRRLISSLKKKRNAVTMARKTIKTPEMKERLENMGINPEEILSNLKQPKFEALLTSDDIDQLVASEDEASMEDDDEAPKGIRRPKPLLAKAQRRLKALSATRRPGKIGIIARKKVLAPNRLEAAYHGDVQAKEKLRKEMVKVNKRYVKPRKGQPRKDQVNEADRFIGTAKPKHLFSGKRTIGKTDWR